jgi:hypothetical protein
VTRVHADIEALKGFREALIRFRYAQREVAERADDAIERTRASLAAKASDAQARLEQARAALEACQAGAGQSAGQATGQSAGPASAGPGDGAADCSAYARAVEQSAERLEQIRRWQQRVDQDASEFRGPASGFRDLLDTGLPRAENQLLASIASLEAARRVEAGSA